MTRLEISEQLYQRLLQQAGHVGLSIEDWLNAATNPQLNELYNWSFDLMGHDLRAPLAAIISSSEILKYYPTHLTDERRVEHLDTIQSQTYALTRLFANLRLLQKMALGALHTDIHSVDLADVMASAWRELHSTINPGHEIRISAHHGPTTFWVDDRLLRQALVNVLLNAAQYSPAMNPIDIDIVVTPQQAVITVMDGGIGIPAAEQARVFDLHYRASNVTDPTGSGLGLTVAQRILFLLGGSIELVSTPGEGTTVHIHLPV